jgi:hypothetical protein
MTSMEFQSFMRQLAVQAVKYQDGLIDDIEFISAIRVVAGEEVWVEAEAEVKRLQSERKNRK